MKKWVMRLTAGHAAASAETDSADDGIAAVLDDRQPELENAIDRRIDEGKLPSAFDPDFYLSIYPDVAEAGQEPQDHYLRHGYFEGRFINRRQLEKAKSALAACGLFDARFYAEHDELADGEDAREAYLTSGTLREVAPNRRFDPIFYKRQCPEWYRWHSPLLHYWHNKHKPQIYPSAEMALAHAKAIGASELFDEAYYRETHLNGETAVDAALHYCLIGVRRGYKPSPDFDTRYYLTAYPDVASSGMNPLIHYLGHGREEGRRARVDAEGFFDDGGRPFDPEKPTILLVCHNATRTGAPVIGLNLAARLCDAFNLVIWIGEPGDIEEEFVPLSALMMRGWTDRAGLESVVSELLTRVNVDAAIVNSVESSVTSPALAKNDIPVLSLIHEFAQYSFPKGKVTRAVLWSNHTVFPSELVRSSFIDELARMHVEGAPRGISVLPQGLCTEGIRTPGPADLSSETLRERLGLEEEGNDQPPFVVVGAGWVQPRKGVDLFIETARRFKALSARPFKFVWVGGNYRPDSDIHYSIWLREQIRGSGLEDDVLMLDGQASLEAIWNLADAFYLPSRLDPYPNVVLEALAHGVPAVCFEGATGSVEIAKHGDFVRPVPYLDCGRAAEALTAIADGDPAVETLDWAQIAPLLDFDVYAERVRALVETAKGVSETRREHRRALTETPWFDENFFMEGLPRWFEVSSWRPEPDETPVKLYTLLAAHGLYLAKSRPGFNDRRYAASAEASKASQSALATAVAQNPDQPPATQRVVEIDAATAPPRNQRRALHIHVHYDELASEIARRLEGFESHCDLFISTTSDEKVARIAEAFEGYGAGEVTIETVPNRGRDIGAFLTAWPGQWEAYDIVGHVHAKKSAELSSEHGRRWRAFLFDHLIEEEAAACAWRAFEEDPRLGLLFPEDPLLIGWTENWEAAQALAQQMACEPMLPEVIEFPLGNMFWARPAALAPLLSVGFEWEDYPREPVKGDGTMLHAIERIWPVVCEAADYRWATLARPKEGLAARTERLAS